MKTLMVLILLAGSANISCADNATPSSADHPLKPVPFSVLNPPAGITPAQTRGVFAWSFPKPTIANPHLSGRLPRQTWTLEERTAYEAKVQWFHEAKYGIAFNYNCRQARGPVKEIGESWQNWDDAKWNAWVDAVDVEKVADQLKELGVGYAIISLGQNYPYFCSPNPVINELWKLKPGQYASRRDLPMEFGLALKKRGIPLMLYVACDLQYRLPVPEGTTREAVFQNWLKALEWYSDHYGTLCRGWWLDGLEESMKNYRVDTVKAARHGNPDALIATGHYEISDFVHGHCRTADWQHQRKFALPFFGRWDQDFNIQWHAYLTVGRTWGASDTPKKTEDLVQYAGNVIRGGGVITFDVGMFEKVNGKWQAPFLEVPPAQFEQLKAVRDALKNLPVTDGSGKH